MGAAPARDVREIIARLREADSLDPAELANKRLLVRAAELAGENFTSGIPEVEAQLRESSDATGEDRSR